MSETAERLIVAHNQKVVIDPTNDMARPPYAASIWEWSPLRPAPRMETRRT